MDNTVKRIYVPDLNTNINLKNEKDLKDEINLKDQIKDDGTKKIIFTGTTTKYQMKKVETNKEKKEKKKKVETNTWNLNEEELSFETQLEILKGIYNNNNTGIKDSKLTNFVVSHIKTKMSSYKHQDLLKNIFLEPDFVTLEYIIDLLNSCNMKCHYCACETYLLYEFVREMKQWSLDRINNDIGHNKGNLVIACLECNLKRRRTNKDAFFMTKNLTISREGL
jgi:MoaA/NifB/PqqE/SkfB family radical SAM enzyme